MTTYSLKKNGKPLKTGPLQLVWRFTLAHVGNIPAAAFRAQGYSISVRGDCNVK